MVLCYYNNVSVKNSYTDMCKWQKPTLGLGIYCDKWIFIFNAQYLCNGLAQVGALVLSKL